MEATEIKAALDELNEVANDKINEFKKELETIKGDNLINQKALDKLLVNNKRTTAAFTEDISLEGQLRKGLFDNTDNLEKMRRKEIKRFSFELKAVQDMSFAGNYTGAGVVTSSAPIGVVGITHRLKHVRDLFRQMQMTGSSLPVLKDGPGEGAPAPVAQGALKPQFDFDLAEISAKAETIAGIVVFNKAFIDDIPSARSWLTDKMTEAYMRVEDDQLLNGDGVSPNLSGINTAGNFTAATSLAAVNNVIQLVSGLIQLLALDRIATGIIIHPTDLGTILLNQSTGSVEFDLPNYFNVNAQGGLSILGVPVVASTAQTVGTYDIIDNSGMLMAFRQNTTIEFFEQDSTNVRYNKITARIESRIAFPIYGSTYVVKGTF